MKPTSQTGKVGLKVETLDRRDVPAVTAAVSGALFADPAHGLGYDGLGDDLARALIA